MGLTSRTRIAHIVARERCTHGLTANIFFSLAYLPNTTFPDARDLTSESWRGNGGWRKPGPPLHHHWAFSPLQQQQQLPVRSATTSQRMIMFFDRTGIYMIIKYTHAPHVTSLFF